MNFKVGQRVRVVSRDRVPFGYCDSHGDRVLGLEGTVVSAGGHRSSHPSLTVRVALDGYKTLWFATHELRPLTDPDSEWADEQIRKLKSLPSFDETFSPFDEPTKEKA